MTAFGIKKTPNQLSSVSSEVEAKNFGLTETIFNQLKVGLKEGDQRLYETIFLQHFNDCQRYLCRNCGANKQESHEAVMETLLKFRMLLITDKVRFGNLRFLFTLMARQQYQKNRKQQQIFTSLPDNASEIPEETVEFTEEEYDLLLRAYNTLSKDCRELLKAFYFGGNTLKKIAKGAERSPAAVRKQKSRCLSKLKQYFYSIS